MEIRVDRRLNTSFAVLKCRAWKSGKLPTFLEIGTFSRLCRGIPTARLKMSMLSVSATGRDFSLHRARSILANAPEAHIQLRDADLEPDRPTVGIGANIYRLRLPIDLPPAQLSAIHRLSNAIAPKSLTPPSNTGCCWPWCQPSYSTLSITTRSPAFRLMKGCAPSIFLPVIGGKCIGSRWPGRK